MSDRYDKYRWLQLAFSDQVDLLNESYYFDRRDNAFFSVFITDFFLTDPTSKEHYPDNPYSEKDLKTLAERIKRLELLDSFILCIPRLTVNERKQMMQEFLEVHVNLHKRDDFQAVIDIENGRTYLNFGNLLQDEEQEEWRLFKEDFIDQKIDTFCNLQNINIDTATLSKDKKMTTMSLGLEDSKEDDTIKQFKPWWKFW